MKKLFYKLFIFGSVLTSFSLVSDTQKQPKKTDIKIVKTPTPLENKTPTQPLQTEQKNETPVKKNRSIQFDKIKNFLKQNNVLPFLQFDKIKDIEIPSLEEINSFVDEYKIFLFQNQKRADDILTFRLMAPTYLFESTKTSTDKYGVVLTEPLDSFYFCTSNALTIGYGTKIEYEHGKLAKEGLEMLQHIELWQNGKLLTMEEKIKLVDYCFRRKKEYDTNHKDKLRYKLFEAQRAILFPNGAPTITKENAFHIAQIEYQDKMDRLLKENPLLGNSYFSISLATDIAFQHGNAGVKRTTYYKVAKNQKQLPSSIQLGAHDRLKLRKLLCKMAYYTQTQNAKRKGAPASIQEQNAATLYAIQSFCSTFKKSIMARDDHTLLLMQEFMTLVFMQNKKNEVQRPLTYTEIETASFNAQRLVYQDIFHSETIMQLPKKIRPITILTAIEKIQKNLSIKQNDNHIELKPTEFLQESLLKESLLQLNKYNKKNKTSIKLTSSTGVILNNKETAR